MSENVCSICLVLTADTDDGDARFVKTSEGHIFHYMCVKYRIERGQNRCPVCEEPLYLNLLSPVRPASAFYQTRSQEDLEFDEGQPDYEVKVVILGDSGVGKSSIMKNFMMGQHSHEEQMTPICSLDTMSNKLVIVGDKLVNLWVWDTAGQEMYRSIAKNYVRNADGALLVYDVTTLESFTSLGEWMGIVKSIAHPDVAMIIDGNKVDEFNRVVHTQDGEKLANALGLSFFETSAKESLNVEAMFQSLVEEIILKKENATGLPKNDENTKQNSRSRQTIKLHHHIQPGVDIRHLVGLSEDEEVIKKKKKFRFWC